jgi:Malectin domain
LLLQFHKRAGLREFDVYVEGLLVIDNLDVFHAAPGLNVPYILSMNTVVNDGFITIEFVAGINDPQINAIEVFRFGRSKAPNTPNAPPLAAPNFVPAATTPLSVPVARPLRPPVTKFPTAAPLVLPPHSQPVPVPPAGSFKDIIINCGGTFLISKVSPVNREKSSNSKQNHVSILLGPLYLDASGLRYWAEDNFFFGGSTYSMSSIPISNTVDDPIYQSERNGDFSYEVPVPVGTYEVNIHLAEM